MIAVIRIMVALLVLVASAEAAPKTARDYYQSATSHYNLSEWQGALDDFREAYRLKPDPALLFNIAQCHRQLGNYREAANFYRAYRREGGTNNVERLIDEMDNAATAQREREAAAERERAANAPPDGVQSPAPTPAPTPAPVQPAEPPPRRSRTLLWTGIGVGAAGLVAVGVGAGLFAVGNSAFQSIDNPKPGYVFSAADEDKSRTWRPAGVALISVGAVLVAGGVTLAVIGVRREKQSATASSSRAFAWSAR